MFSKEQTAYEIKKYGRRNAETIHSRTEGVRGRVKYRSCQHGTVVIDDYKPTGNRCEECERRAPLIFDRAPAAIKNDPFFNFGLGCVTENTRQAEKIARQRGLEPMGDEVIEPYDWKPTDDKPIFTKEDINKARSGK